MAQNFMNGFGQQQPLQEASFFKGAPGGFTQQNTVRPEQLSAIQQILKMALGGLQNPQAGYEPFAQAARQNFQENTLPSIFERFTSLGKGAQSSGAFQGLLGRAGADLESGLAQGAAQYGQQQQQLWQNLLGQGLMPTFENIYRPRQASGAESLLPGLIQAGADLGSAYLTSGGSTLKQLLSALTNKG